MFLETKASNGHGKLCMEDRSHQRDDEKGAREKTSQMDRFIVAVTSDFVLSTLD